MRGFKYGRVFNLSQVVLSKVVYRSVIRIFNVVNVQSTLLLFSLV